MRKTNFGLSFLFSLSLLSPCLAFCATSITICTDNNFWYPFTFVKGNNIATGLHIDIIQKALLATGYEPKFMPMSWKDCLNLAKEGKVDAIATASYKDDRAAYLYYPSGAAVDRKSPYRVSQVEYRVITSSINKDGSESPYVFNGNLKEIPKPVRVTESYSIITDLRKEGVTVTEGKNNLENFKNLITEKTGSVIDLNEVAKYLSSQSDFKDKLTIQPHPLSSKSYYLAFTKGGAISLEEAEPIWKEIAIIREDPKLMTEFLKKY